MVRKAASQATVRLPWLIPAGIGLLAFLLFLPSIDYDFTFDDGVIVARNPAVQEWGHWKLVLFSDYWPSSQTALYRPLTILSFALERLIHGSEPSGFHLVNVVLHSLVSVFVLFITLELTKSGWGALLAAALFAVHPLHSEVVCGIVGRAELLSSLFALCAILLYLRRARRGKSSRFTTAWVSLLFFLGLCSKENVIVLPMLLLLWELSRNDQKRSAAALRLFRQPAFWGLLTAALGYLLLRMMALGGFRAPLIPNPPFVENPLSAEQAATRIISGVADQAHGLLLHVIPFPLVADYSYRTLQLHSHWYAPGFLVMAAAAIGAAGLWLSRGRTTSNLALGSAWYLVAVLPASNIPFIIGTIFAERLFYFPSVGFCICVAVLWEMVARRSLREWTVPRELFGRMVLGFGTLLILTLCVLTAYRSPAWRNDLALFTDTVAKAPENVKARLWLGDAFVKSGNPAAAVEQYQKALEIYPKYAAAGANMVVPLSQLRRLNEAIEAGERARSLFPQDNATVLYNLALVYLENGNPLRFLQLMQHLLELDPQNSYAHFQLGMYYLQHEGNRQAAREHFAETLRLDPQFAQANLIRSFFPDLR